MQLKYVCHHVEEKMILTLLNVFNVSSISVQDKNTCMVCGLQIDTDVQLLFEYLLRKNYSPVI